MKFYFIVEGHFGPQFIKTVFQQKTKEGLFPGKLIEARRSTVSTKLARIVKIAPERTDHTIILMNANGNSPDKKTEKIKQYVDSKHLHRISIILFDYSMEEWICHSLGLKVKGKPSEILWNKFRYQNDQLLSYASKLDCEKLKSCPSFQRLLATLVHKA